MMFFNIMYCTKENYPGVLWLILLYEEKVAKDAVTKIPLYQ